MNRSRLEAFSDGVIAIILTIMVLELHAPHDPSWETLLETWPKILSYILSFISIAIYWVNHHHLVHLIEKVNARTLWANMNLIFWISLIPWATSCLGESHASAICVALYGAIASACCISFHILRETIICYAQSDHKIHQWNVKMRIKNITALVIYLISLPLAWVYVPLSIAFIAAPAVIYFIPDRRVETLHIQGRQEKK
jgi:uncharacterized membrane protein